MSEKQHKSDTDAGLEHKSSNDKEGAGGKCLNRHIGRKKEDSCSHIWQSYLRMFHDDSEYYVYPRYKALVDTTDPIEGAYKKAHPKNATAEASLGAPTAGSWDPPAEKDYMKAGTNFSVCYLPYWHEAHHIVPNSTLRTAIKSVAVGATDPDGYAIEIRRALLAEEYNLNYRKNMIMLPMNSKVGKAMSLPLHRRTAKYWSHNDYSDNVLAELKKIFGEAKKNTDKHKEEPDFGEVKNDIEMLSDRLRVAILGTFQPSVDEMKEEEFVKEDNNAF